MFTGGIVRPMLLCFNHNRVMPPFAPSASSSQHTPSAWAIRDHAFDGACGKAAGGAQLEPAMFYLHGSMAKVPLHAWARSTAALDFAILLHEAAAKSHPSKRNNRKKSVGSTETSRASPKPASRPSSHHTAAVSGKSQLLTWCQIWSHSAGVNTLYRDWLIRSKRSSHAPRSSSSRRVGS